MKKKASNTFTEGMVTDYHPLTAPSNSLTSALNATLITMNGNEMALLNDMGNCEVELAELTPGFIPVGMKEYGGIIYIASVDPDGVGEIGSFPSPELNLDSDELGELEVSIDDGKFPHNTPAPGNDIKYFDLNVFIHKVKLMKDEDVIRSGDKFLIAISLTDLNLVDLINNGIVSLKLCVLDSSNNLVDITKDVVKVTIRNNRIVPSNTGQFFAITTQEGNVDQLLNGAREEAFTVYNNKLIGGLYLITEVNVLQDCLLTVDPSKEEGTKKLKITIEYLCPDTVNENNWDDYIDNYVEEPILEINLVEGSISDSVAPLFISREEFIEERILKYTYRATVTKDLVNITVTPQMNLDATLESNIIPIESLIQTKSIDFTKVGTGSLDISSYKYYNTDSYSRFTLGFDSYPLVDEEINDILFRCFDVYTVNGWDPDKTFEEIGENLNVVPAKDGLKNLTNLLTNTSFRSLDYIEDPTNVETSNRPWKIYFGVGEGETWTNGSDKYKPSVTPERYSDRTTDRGVNDYIVTNSFYRMDMREMDYEIWKVEGQPNNTKFASFYLDIDASKLEKGAWYTLSFSIRGWRNTGRGVTAGSTSIYTMIEGCKLGYTAETVYIDGEQATTSSEYHQKEWNIEWNPIQRHTYTFKISADDIGVGSGDNKYVRVLFRPNETVLIDIGEIQLEKRTQDLINNGEYATPWRGTQLVAEQTAENPELERECQFSIGLRKDYNGNLSKIVYFDDSNLSNKILSGRAYVVQVIEKTKRNGDWKYLVVGYRWLITSKMYNEYYSTVSDYNNLSEELLTKKMAVNIATRLLKTSTNKSNTTPNIPDFVVISNSLPSNYDAYQQITYDDTYSITSSAAIRQKELYPLGYENAINYTFNYSKDSSSATIADILKASAGTTIQIADPTISEGDPTGDTSKYKITINNNALNIKTYLTSNIQVAYTENLGITVNNYFKSANNYIYNIFGNLNSDKLPQHAGYIGVGGRPRGDVHRNVALGILQKVGNSSYDISGFTRVYNIVRDWHVDFLEQENIVMNEYSVTDTGGEQDALEKMLQQLSAFLNNASAVVIEGMAARTGLGGNGSREAEKVIDINEDNYESFSSRISLSGDGLSMESPDRKGPWCAGTSEYLILFWKTTAGNYAVCEQMWMALDVPHQPPSGIYNEQPLGSGASMYLEGSSLVGLIYEKFKRFYINTGAQVLADGYILDKNNYGYILGYNAVINLNLKTTASLSGDLLVNTYIENAFNRLPNQCRYYYDYTENHTGFYKLPYPKLELDDVNSITISSLSYNYAAINNDELFNDIGVLNSSIDCILEREVNSQKTYISHTVDGKFLKASRNYEYINDPNAPGVIEIDNNNPLYIFEYLDNTILIKNNMTRMKSLGRFSGENWGASFTWGRYVFISSTIESTASTLVKLGIQPTFSIVENNNTVLTPLGVAAVYSGGGKIHEWKRTTFPNIRLWSLVSLDHSHAAEAGWDAV